MATNYGKFELFYTPNTCLIGFKTVNSHRITNLGLVLLSFFAVILACLFILYAERRPGAVGRREMQILYLSYVIVSLSAMFASGGFITNRTILVYFSAIEIASTVATAWLLIINAIVAYQLIPDGSFISTSLTLLSAICVFVGSGYICLDSAFDWTNTFTLQGPRNYAIYTIYLLFPIIAIVIYFLLEMNLVIRVLRERKPAILLWSAFLLFAIGQIFEFVVSKHICSRTSGKIDGSLFACLFTLFSFGALWAFWGSITEDDWVMPFEPHDSEYRPANYWDKR